MWAPDEWEADFVSLQGRDASRPYHCPSYKLPALGVIELSPGNTINLTANAVFRPQCLSSTGTQPGSNDDGTGGLTSIADIRDPFHASITPQAYATGAATVIAWMLVIMLIITPRTFFVGNASGRSGLMGRSGMISGASGSGSIIGVGSRPWLQKAAALTVAVSLTLATADTFKIAGEQYEEGFIDAKELRDQVVAGLEIQVSRIISDVFLWLAQVQTLIRLFPRHKEKVIIKWVGFALIVLDITFSSLNSFGPYEKTQQRPAHFDSAIPALSYLFQLSLSMLYAAWVMYYAITKRRYAFYHAMMWNMSVVALLSIVAILTPVVFFITDIANYTIAGWGDYFRWVGAAAASVIVWEWVERIEALEREEKKDGILGREIYDGDDMLDNTPSSSTSWPSKHESRDSGKGDKKGSGRGGFGAFAFEHSDRFNEFAQKLGRKMNESPRAEARKKRTIHVPAPAPVLRRSQSANQGNRDSRNYQRVQSPPQIPVVSSPVSRTDTTSADSTVYTVHYHPISQTPPNPSAGPNSNATANQEPNHQQEFSNQDTLGRPTDPDDVEKGTVGPDPVVSRSKWQWQAVGNAFKRKGRTPPQELQRGRVIEPLGVEDVAANVPPRSYNGWALTDRLGTLAAQSGEMFRSKKKSASQLETNLPVTIIPAQPRGQTWSPDILQQRPLQQPQYYEDAMGNSGVQLARIPTVIKEEETSASPAQSGGGTNSSQVANQSSTPTSHRNPHTRSRSDSSRSWQKSVQGPVGAGLLGTEVRQVPAADSTLPPPDETTATVDFSVIHSHTRTDHDR